MGDIFTISPIAIVSLTLLPKILIHRAPDLYPVIYTTDIYAISFFIQILYIYPLIS